jgi:hypothetical protein
LGLKKEEYIKSYNLSCVSRINDTPPTIGKIKHDEDKDEILKELS